MKRHGFLLSIVCASVLSGCANSNNVDTSNEATTLEVAPVETVIESNVNIVTLTVKKNERYVDSIARAMKEKGITNVAWTLPLRDMEKLRAYSASTTAFNGVTIESAFNDMAKNLGIQAYLHYRLIDKVAAVVAWDSEIDIALVKGEHLKEALENITLRYGWNWIKEGSQGQSYLATSNYNFPHEYPLATIKGNFGQAIGTIIAPYPVRAELNENNRTIIVLDAQ